MVTDHHEARRAALPCGSSVKHCEDALELAGRALDPNRPGGQCLALGRLLLTEAFLAASRATSGDDSLASVEAALDALRRRSETRGNTGHDRRWDETGALLTQNALPDCAALRGAELEIARLLDVATGRRRVGRAEHRGLWVVLGLVVATAALLILATLSLRRPWERYTWVGSSGWGGFNTSGTLWDHDWTYDLLFHTEEEENPWVVIDLLATRTVGKITVVNRSDCCQDRGLPLVVEVAGVDRQFVQVGLRTSRFDVWKLTFPRREARYVRLRAKGRTILHLRDVEIR
jgi:hypothetical protein